MGILPRCNYLSTTVWLHHFEFNEALNKLDENCSKMLHPDWNKSRNQHRAK